MPLVVPDVGEVRLLRYIVGNTYPTSLILQLYTNDLTPVDTSTDLSFTSATATSYAPATLSPNSWGIGTTSGTSSALYNSGITFTFGTAAATQNVYGYYVTDQAGALLWAERFPGAPFALPQSGGEIAIRPQVQLS